MNIEFHTDTFRLLSFDSRFNIEIQNDSFTVENRFSESVNEWVNLQRCYSWFWKTPYCRKYYEILEFYSNTDSFWLESLDDEKSVFNESLDKKLIFFGQEHQGNFDLAFEFDSKNPNPPVYIKDLDEQYSLFFKTFSEFVYTQIYDWQFRLAFLPEWESDIDYYEIIELPDKNFEDMIKFLSAGFKKEPETDYFWEKEHIIEKRFSRENSRARFVNQSGKKYIEVVGLTDEDVKLLASEFKLSLKKYCNRYSIK